MNDFWKWHEENLFKATAAFCQVGLVELLGIERYENDTEVVHVLETWNVALNEFEFEIISIELKDVSGKRSLSKAQRAWTKEFEMMKQVLNTK